ncbi:zinc ion binding protein [Actinidia rufa]|uniref:Zinc ion binding protein n=1 Tax=Actinidia rufa TaxID=165716 RepID=A0A7J0DVE5_9ERIC|nr:zinc ion binding protein [Actinidia rufa]
MVWFQCEDCGENLKKPKLPNHFRICSATKLSCIDCGQIFGQQSVQVHTQCITEAEKYGPKGQGKAPNVTNAKPNNDAKQKPDVDVNVGLSERPPWFCSLCNTNATSKQTLLLHAEGKKHRAKARAFHAANKKPEQSESAPNTKASPQSNQNDELTANMGIDQPKGENPPIVTPLHNGCEAGNENSLSSELGNGEVIQVERAVEVESKCQIKKAKHSVTEEDAKKKIKWKKLIKSVLKSNPENVLKMKKLRKLVLKDLRESGFTEDKSELTDMLDQKIIDTSSDLSPQEGSCGMMIPRGAGAIFCGGEWSADSSLGVPHTAN